MGPLMIEAQICEVEEGASFMQHRKQALSLFCGNMEIQSVNSPEYVRGTYRKTSS